MGKVMDIDELAECLGVKKATIYFWVSQKKISHIKLTKRLLKFREQEIMNWIAQKTVSAEPPAKSKVLAIGRKDRHYGRPSSGLTDEYIARIVRNAKAEVLKR